MGGTEAETMVKTGAEMTVKTGAEMTAKTGAEMTAKTGAEMTGRGKESVIKNKLLLVQLKVGEIYYE